MSTSEEKDEEAALITETARRAIETSAIVRAANALERIADAVEDERDAALAEIEEKSDGEERRARAADELRARMEDPRRIKLLAVNGRPVDEEAAQLMLRNLTGREDGLARVAAAIRLTVANAMRAVEETAPDRPYGLRDTLHRFGRDCTAGEQSASELVADLFVAACGEVLR